MDSTPDADRTIVEEEPRALGDADVDDVFVFPASIAQRRFWLLDQFEPGNPAYNTPIALRISGILDAARSSEL